MAFSASATQKGGWSGGQVVRWSGATVRLLACHQGKSLMISSAPPHFLCFETAS